MELKDLGAFLKKEGINLEEQVANIQVSDSDISGGRKIVDASSQESELLAGRLFAYVYRIDSLRKEIMVEREGYTIQKTTEPSTGQDYLEIWGGLDNGYSYIMRVAVDSIRDSVKISNEFFAYFVAAGLVVGTLSVIWISNLCYC